MDVHQQGLRIDVDKSWDGAAAHDGVGGGGERIRDRDDLVFGANPRRPERQLQGIGTVATRDRFVRAAVGGELILEQPDFLPQDEIRGGKNPVNSDLKLGPQSLVLGPQVGKRYGRRRRRRRCLRRVRMQAKG